MFNLFIKDGNFREWLRVCLVIFGIASVGIGFYIGITLVLGFLFFIMGFVLAAIGGYAAQAHMLRLKPFDDAFKKARESYEDDGIEEKK